MTPARKDETMRYVALALVALAVAWPTKSFAEA